MQRKREQINKTKLKSLITIPAWLAPESLRHVTLDWLFPFKLLQEPKQKKIIKQNRIELTRKMEMILALEPDSTRFL